MPGDPVLSGLGCSGSPQPELHLQCRAQTGALKRGRAGGGSAAGGAGEVLQNCGEKQTLM